MKRGLRRSGVVLFLSVLGALASGAAAERALAEDPILRQSELGPVQVELRVRPAAPVIGDVIELELEVKAESGVEIFMPEFGEALGRFEIVDFAPRQGGDEQGRIVFTQTYRLQPAHSGSHTIPPLRVEFVDRRPGSPPAPDGEDAYELLTERVSLEVEAILAEGEPLVLRPRIADLGPRRDAAMQTWIWLVAIAVSLAVLAPFAWRGFVAARARQRRQSAYEVARAELDRLLEAGRPTEATMDAFYVRLSLIVRTYLEDRFALRSPELTTQEFLTEMGRSPDLARSHQRLLQRFLEQADLVKFAGHRPSDEDVSESIAGAEQFLTDTRNFVRTHDVVEIGAAEGRASLPGRKSESGNA